MVISIHALREEGDTGETHMNKHFFISIHALREEGDLQVSSRLTKIFRFLSTPSARRATSAVAALHLGDGISIHALREEGDRYFSSSSLSFR